MESTLITSLQNPKVKETVRLKERRERDKTDKFIIEGYREISRALISNRAIEYIFYCPELFQNEGEDKFVAKMQSQKIETYRCPENVFLKLSYREGPDGLLAVAFQQHVTLKNLYLSKNPLIVVAEAIEKPGNLGTILRSADGVGADLVILCDRCTDLHNPNVVRASMGALFTVPVVETTTSEAVTWLKKSGIQILAATPHAIDEYTQVDLTTPLAIAFGTEKFGLSDVWMNASDIQVKIPMRGIADSLNVAMSTTLLLYEALRQRSHK